MNIGTPRGVTGKIIKLLSFMVVLTGLYLLFVSLFSRNLGDNDLWGYLSFGRVFWEKGYFPSHDIFSYTPTKALWIYHEWLTGVIFYVILMHAGPAGLQLLQYLIIILTLCLIYATAIKKGANTVFALIALIPAMLLISFGYFPVRAQIFTYLFFVLTVYILETAKIKRQWEMLLWLLPVYILWCNLHGGFVAGLGIIALYTLGEGISGKKIVPFIAIFFLAGLATLINPYGLEYWRFLTDSLSMSRPEIGEWFSVSTALKTNYQPVPVFVFILLSSISILIVLWRGKKSLTELIIIAATIYIGVRHVRHTIFLGIIFGTFMPRMLNDLWKSCLARRQNLTKNPLSFPLVMLTIVFLFIYWFSNQSMIANIKPSFAISAFPSRYPVGAVEWMKKNHSGGKILPDFDWGEYIIWECYPDLKVAMDGRYETVYEEKTCREYFDFLTGREGWNVFLKKYPPDFILIKPMTNTCLLMLRDPAWKTVYIDHWSILFARK